MGSFNIKAASVCCKKTVSATHSDSCSPAPRVMHSAIASTSIICIKYEHALSFL